MRVIFGGEIVDTKLEKHFRLIIAGGSGTGKTSILKNIVDNNHFSSSFDKTVYCYPDYLEEIPTDLIKLLNIKQVFVMSNFLLHYPKTPF